MTDRTGLPLTVKTATPEQLQKVADKYHYHILSGKIYTFNYLQAEGKTDCSLLLFERRKTREELDKGWKKPVRITYSQHSSIVMNKEVPALAMAFDLAVGQCKSFTHDGGKFWKELLHTANWRDPKNAFADAAEYYKSGKLPEYETKRFMNKPKGALPVDEFGVVNEFNSFSNVTDAIKWGPEGVVNIQQYQDQWKMPVPLTDAEIDKE